MRKRTQKASGIESAVTMPSLTAKPRRRKTLRPTLMLKLTRTLNQTRMLTLIQSRCL